MAASSIDPYRLPKAYTEKLQRRWESGIRPDLRRQAERVQRVAQPQVMSGLAGFSVLSWVISFLATPYSECDDNRVSNIALFLSGAALTILLSIGGLRYSYRKAIGASPSERVQRLRDAEQNVLRNKLSLRETVSRYEGLMAGDSPTITRKALNIWFTRALDRLREGKITLEAFIDRHGMHCLGNYLNQRSRESLGTIIRKQLNKGPSTPPSDRVIQLMEMLDFPSSELTWYRYRQAYEEFVEGKLPYPSFREAVDIARLWNDVERVRGDLYDGFIHWAEESHLGFVDLQRDFANELEIFQPKSWLRALVATDWEKVRASQNYAKFKAFHQRHGVEACMLLPKQRMESFKKEVTQLAIEGLSPLPLESISAERGVLERYDIDYDEILKRHWIAVPIKGILQGDEKAPFLAFAQKKTAFWSERAFKEVEKLEPEQIFHQYIDLFKCGVLDASYYRPAVLPALDSLSLAEVIETFGEEALDLGLIQACDLKKQFREELEAHYFLPKHQSLEDIPSWSLLSRYLPNDLKKPCLSNQQQWTEIVTERAEAIKERYSQYSSGESEAGRQAREKISASEELVKVAQQACRDIVKQGKTLRNSLVKAKELLQHYREVSRQGEHIAADLQALKNRIPHLENELRRLEQKADTEEAVLRRLEATLGAPQQPWGSIARCLRGTLKLPLSSLSINQSGSCVPKVHRNSSLQGQWITVYFSCVAVGEARARLVVVQEQHRTLLKKLECIQAARDQVEALTGDIKRGSQELAVLKSSLTQAKEQYRGAQELCKEAKNEAQSLRNSASRSLGDSLRLDISEIRERSEAALEKVRARFLYALIGSTESLPHLESPHGDMAD